MTAVLGRLTEQLTPRLFGLLTFLSGVVLLFSGATPAAPGRLERLEAWLPLGVIEVSHFTGSVVGVVLLLLSQGLARRLDAAYYLAAGAIGVGHRWRRCSRGSTTRKRSLLTCVLVVPACGRGRRSIAAPRSSRPASRPCGSRRSCGALGASIWLGLFAFKHVDYSQQLWWQFALRGEASRFLRASVGAAVVVLLFGVAPARAARAARGRRAVRRRICATRRAIIAAQPRTSAQPRLPARQGRCSSTRTRTGFVMYGVQGRTLGGAGRSGRPGRGGERT